MSLCKGSKSLHWFKPINSQHSKITNTTYNNSFHRHHQAHSLDYHHKPNFLISKVRLDRKTRLAGIPLELVKNKRTKLIHNHYKTQKICVIYTERLCG